MKMTHQGKDPEMYGNKEAGGSHGEVRYNPEKAPKSKGRHGGSTSHGYMGIRTKHRPYFPTFIDEHIQQEQVDDFVE